MDHFLSSSPSVTVTIMSDSPSNFFYRPPPAQNDNYAEILPTENIHMSGRIHIYSKEPRLAKQLLVKYSTSYQMAFPGRGRETGVLDERTLLFGEGEALRIDAGDNYFDYMFIFGNTLPGFTRTPYGRINHRMEAKLIGAPTSRFGGLFGSPSLSPRRSSSPSSSGGRSPARGVSPQGDRSPRMSFASLTPPLSPPPSFTKGKGPGSPTSSSFMLPPSIESPPEDIKWVSGTLSCTKDLWIYPVKDVRGGATGLDFYARPTVPDLGLWPWSIEMRNCGVGNFLLFKTSMVGGHPLATIYAIKLYITESITLKSLQRPEEEPIAVPPINNLLASCGHMPKDKEQPIWEGPDVPHKVGAMMETVQFEKICRMPDENKMRPSTLPGIKTPLHIKHEFRMQIFFSVWGEDVQGNALPNDGPGEPRLATVTCPVMVAGCCNIFESNLPTYEDAISPVQAPVKPPHEGIMENCACGMPLERLFARELARDHGITDESVEDERGRSIERKVESESNGWQGRM